MCFNGIVQSEYTVPTLTTVRQSVDQIAQKAICYDSLRLRVGISEPQTKPITVLQSVDNQALLSLIFNTIKGYGKNRVV